MDCIKQDKLTYHTIVRIRKLAKKKMFSKKGKLAKILNAPST